MRTSSERRGSGKSAAGPRLLVAGPNGRLGRAILAEAASQGLEALPLPSPRLGHPTAVVDADRRAFPPLLRARLRGVDVFVTATAPEAEEVQMPLVAEAHVPAVVATTGLDPAPPWLRRAAEKIPIVLDPNFSQGIHLLRRVVRALGPLPEGFDASLVEAHRRDKPDHPSGTARALAAELKGSGYALWEGARGTRNAGAVEIASLRGGNAPGVHELWLTGPGERLRFEHVVFDRSAFARGVLRSARWLHAGRSRTPPRLYSFADVLDGSRE